MITRPVKENVGTESDVGMGTNQERQEPRKHVSYRRGEDVIRAILRRELRGLSLKSTVVKENDGGLASAARRYFQNWGNALRASGIDPEAVTGLRIWTADRVVRSIHGLARQGVALNYNSVKCVDYGLAQAGQRFFGRWDDALKSAGYDPSRIRCTRRPWRKEDIIALLKDQAASGVPVMKRNLRPTSSRLAAWRLFGSFAAALREAGVEHLAAKRRRWSGTAVIEAIRTRKRAGQPVNCRIVAGTDRSLYWAARRYLGGWDEALRATGIDPEQVRLRHRPWTPDDVVRELIRRAEDGQPAICLSSIRPTTLRSACVTHFGSFEEAAEAAGVDPATIGYRVFRGRRSKKAPEARAK